MTGAVAASAASGAPVPLIRADVSNFKWNRLSPVAIDNIIGNWLEVREILALDSAITNKRSRALLDKLYVAMEIVAFNKYDFTSTISLKWMIKRKLDISGFTVHLHNLPVGFQSFQWLVGQNMFSYVDLMIKRAAKSCFDPNLLAEFPFAAQEGAISPLLLAVKNNWHSMCQALASSKRIDMSLRCGVHHNSPLHEAVKNANVTVTRWLLEKSATHNVEINSLNANDETPLYTAASKGLDDILEKLLAKGADVNMQCTHGFSALHIAAQMGHLRTMKLLVEAAAAVDAQTDVYRVTPLHLACRTGNRRIIRWLVANAKANVYLFTSDGWSPYTQDPKGIASMLKDAGLPVHHQEPLSVVDMQHLQQGGAQPPLVSPNRLTMQRKQQKVEHMEKQQ